MSWVLVNIIAILLLVDLLVHILSVRVALPIFESKPPFGVVLSPPTNGAEPVAFSTTNGLTLRGSLYRHDDHPSRGLIIFCPELGGNHWSAMSYCQGLWDAGFDILAFDFRNQGDSDHMPGYEPLHWLTEYEVDDALAAIAFAKQHEALQQLPIGLFGISRGGSAALAAAARSPEVKRLACDGAFSTESMLLHYTRRWATLYCHEWILNLVPDWHLRMTLAMIRCVSQLRKNCHYTNLERLLPLLHNRPVQLISGERDTYVLPSITRHLCRTIGRGCREAWIVPQAKHNMARRVAPVEYDRRLVHFFSGMAPQLGKKKPLHSGKASLFESPEADLEKPQPIRRTHL